MTPKTKKVIAKEGLILFPFIVAFIILTYLESFLYSSECSDALFATVILGYPLTRFTVWAIKTLKEKNE